MGAGAADSGCFSMAGRTFIFQGWQRIAKTPRALLLIKNVARHCSMPPPVGNSTLQRLSQALSPPSLSFLQALDIPKSPVSQTSPTSSISKRDFRLRLLHHRSNFGPFKISKKARHLRSTAKLRLVLWRSWRWYWCHWHGLLLLHLQEARLCKKMCGKSETAPFSSETLRLLFF